MFVLLDMMHLKNIFMEKRYVFNILKFKKNKLKLSRNSTCSKTMFFFVILNNNKTDLTVRKKLFSLALQRRSQIGLACMKTFCLFNFV